MAISTPSAPPIQSRKKEHVEAVLNGNVGYRHKTNGFEAVDFEHCALPELDWEEIDTATEFLGFKLKAPLMVTGMTGGYADAETINNDIAAACEAEGVAFGLGSMRAMIEKPELKATFSVRKRAPKTFIAGNIGGIQLKKIPVEKIRAALDDIGANALCIHLNPSQEAVQAGGDVDWKGVLPAIENCCKKLGKPVIVKEVGSGISGPVARRLEAAGASAIDVAGAGGTSWVAVELARGGNVEGGVLWDWGVPTAVAVQQVRHATKLPIIASGGIRSGLEAAKAIRLGAALAGGAAPFIKAQKQGGTKAVQKEIQSWVSQLKMAMLCTGSTDLKALRNARLCPKLIV